MKHSLFVAAVLFSTLGAIPSSYGRAQDCDSVAKLYNAQSGMSCSPVFMQTPPYTATGAYTCTSGDSSWGLIPQNDGSCKAIESN